MNSANKTDTKCLGFLRFLAACVIAFFWHYQHFGNNFQYPFSSVFHWSYNYGYLMVELFFALSGFGMFLGYADRIAAHQISFKDYILKRLKKLYPLFLFSLLLVTVLQSVHLFLYRDTFVYQHFDLYYFFLNLILCQCGLFCTDFSYNGPAWSITVFFILYVIFYLIVYHAKSTKIAAYSFVGVFFMGIFIRSQPTQSCFLFNDNVARGLVCFPIGVLLAALYRKSERMHTAPLGYISLFIVLTIYACYRFSVEVIEEITMLFILFVIPAIILSILFVPRLNQLFSLKPFQYLGSLSFEIYLLHFSVQLLLRNIEQPVNFHPDYSKPYYLLLYFGATIITAIVYKELISKRMSKFLSRLIEDIIPKKATQDN